MRPRPMLTVNRVLRVWWPTFVAMAAVCLMATLSFVTYTVVDERRYFTGEAARDRRQDAQMERLIEDQQAAFDRRSRESAEDVAEALTAAEALLVNQFARHDRNVALKLNELLHRIAALLERPAGTPPNPVNAIGTSTERTTTIVRPSPPSPTTTTPDQRSCTKRPDGPRC